MQEDLCLRSLLMDLFRWASITAGLTQGNLEAMNRKMMMILSDWFHDTMDWINKKNNSYINSWFNII